MSKLIYLVRHGQSQGNIEGRVQGLLDSPLSERGQTEAHCLGQRLVAEIKVDLIFTSPLKRAQDTAQILAHYLDCPLKLDDDLREYNMGPITGLTPPEIKAKYPARYLAFERNEYPNFLPGEEGAVVFEQRVQQGFERVLTHLEDGQSAVVVSHSGTLNACLRNWLDIKNLNQRPFAFGNASVTVMAVNPRDKLLIRLNDTCHLAALKGLNGDNHA
ncbi:MAG: histidine phosphatase family protein [Anaerolineae bacterium]|nr:histidine phosphatase family protein [Anaerolineae bacterium]